jgi:hypothetical protein
MNKIIYISDYFFDEVLGGGELNDQEMIKILQNKLNIKLFKFKSSNININDLNKDDFFIISNFTQLKEDCKLYLEKNCKYVIYEHDHKYLIHRNPAIYKNFLAPKEHIINLNFYKSAKTIFCQSDFHKNIVYKNLLLNNIYNLSGNLWSDEILNYIKDINNNTKNDKFAILSSPIVHKNTKETIDFCNYKNYKFELVADTDYKNFLYKLNLNKGLIFLPKTPETLSRLAVEARMLNLQTICNNNVGAAYESWFRLKGTELVEYMLEKKEKITNIILERLNE